ncbi:unannotated protein [freshwater metagenome]|uniref:Unannotated protein n=1 Tax=freshwater metagenome TaxID=449393 RepID=A0A6J6UUZ8_9ZZZZ
MGLRSMRARKNESENERWLLATMAGPFSGTFSTPSSHGRKSTRSHGPMRMYFRIQYSKAPPELMASAMKPSVAD